MFARLGTISALLIGALLITRAFSCLAEQAFEPEISLQKIEEKTVQLVKEIQFNEPKYSPRQIEQIVGQYIKSHSEIDLSEYRLRDLTFNYVSNEFWVFYVHKDPDVALGMHFTLIVSNEIEAKIKLHRGI